MAQITDKRTNMTSQIHTTTNKDHTHSGRGHQHGHGHHTTTHARAKENASSGVSSGGGSAVVVGSGSGKQSKKGLEILDFHESWLEEVEIYKDQLYVSKHQSPMLSTHNHLHTAKGCQLDSTHTASTPGSNIGAIANAATGYEAPKLGSPKRKSAIFEKLAKPRIIVRSAANPDGHGSIPLGIPGDSTNSYKHVQLLLKRVREESFAKATNAKRSNNAANHNPTHNPNAAKTGSMPIANSVSSGIGTGVVTVSGSATTATSNGGGGGAAAAAAAAAAAVLNPSKAANKIVVNTFHASSLLNSQHHDEKTNFLTQNGLTKSAATAYETSLYASHYLPTQDKRLDNIYNSGGIRHLSGAEHANYMGVSLAKLDAEQRRNSGQAEDDPCAAIDDVNDYDDTDSDEEYTGCPFYLEEDGAETHQSRNIRQHFNNSSKNTSEMSSETDQSSDYYKPLSILTPSLFPNVPPYLNFTSHVDKGSPMPAALHRVLKWKLSPVMPKIVKRVVLNSGFRIIKNTTDWMAVWEKHMKSPGFRTIRSHQKYNHIPGSFRIGRKDTMWRSIHNNMKKYGNKEFGFMQKSYIMPDDLENLRQVWPKNASKLTKWIVKPPASARGTGIRVVNKWSQFPKDRPLVVQKYIERPLLINDNKFDMRLYVVLTSINPLRIYMYKDGLARFAAVKYSSELSNLDERCMHLTNYSINKFSQNYTKNEDFNACHGHKWTLQSLWSCLETRGVNTKRLWATLRNLVIKAIISGESGLNRMYRQNVNFRYNCFELFGFDVLLDENLIPWLLEINISPSLHSELPLDLHVKGPLIQAVLNTALYQVPPKLNEKQQKDILEELNLKGPLCHDKRIFTTCLTADEVRKHNQFTNRSIEFREEYLDTILDHLMPDDVRCLMVAEDELARCKPLERIFPTPDTHIYLRFIENPRYYNRLLDAWEYKYGHCRNKGITILQQFCQDGYHLQVSDAAMEKEPNVALTEIDMLHVRKDELVDAPPPAQNADTKVGDSANSKAPEKTMNTESTKSLVSKQTTVEKETTTPA